MVKEIVENNMYWHIKEGKCSVIYNSWMLPAPHITSNTHHLVQDIFANGHINDQVEREVLGTQFCNIMRTSCITISKGKDLQVWKLRSSRNFSISSAWDTMYFARLNLLVHLEGSKQEQILWKPYVFEEYHH